MDIEIIKNNYFANPNFVQEQFLFEVTVLNRIIKLCNPKMNQEFRQCVKEQKQLRKDFKNKLDTYFSQLQAKLYEQMKLNCFNKNDDDVVECLMQQAVDQNEINNQMQQFKEWRRNKMKTLL